MHRSSVRQGLALGCTLLLTICGSPTILAVGQGNDLLPDIPQGTIGMRLEVVATIAGIVIDIADANDGSGRLFVVSPEGIIRVVSGGVVLPTPFLDEPAVPTDMGMSSLAFHPDFVNNGKLYVITGKPTAPNPDYDSPQDDTFTAFDNILYEYQVDSINPDIVDVTTRREVLRIHQPHKFHNLGDLAFGDDGFLYISSGDGGITREGTPTHHNTTGQQTSNPFGGILRIDVNQQPGGASYAIPPGNPFADGADGNVPELIAWGMRNPWRISVDRLTGDVYTGINGDITIEQIDRVEIGRNYGWDVKEGSFLWNPASGEATVDPAPDPQYTAPTAEYDHNHTTTAFGSMIGGYVYRGRAMPEFWGKYISLDFVAAQMIVMDPADGSLVIAPVDPLGAQLVISRDVTFGEDENGELYIGSSEGQLLRVFQADDPLQAGRVPDGDALGGLPLTLNKVGNGMLDLEWGASCEASSDYAIYAGTLGVFSSHDQVVCSTASLESATVPPGPGSEFYLVVPHNGVNEGSYGTDTQGAPRPASLTECFPRLMGPC
jgi:glucose/arabinose dehydrogenase